MNKMIIFGIASIILGILHFVFYKKILNMQGPSGKYDYSMETRKSTFITGGIVFILAGIYLLVKGIYN